MKFLFYILISISIILFIVGTHYESLENIGKNLYANFFDDNALWKTKVDLVRKIYSNDGARIFSEEQRSRQQEIREKTRSEKLRMQNVLEAQRARDRDNREYLGYNNDFAAQRREEQSQRMAEVQARYREMMESRRYNH